VKQHRKSDISYPISEIATPSGVALSRFSCGQN